MPILHYALIKLLILIVLPKNFRRAEKHVGGPHRPETKYVSPKFLRGSVARSDIYKSHKDT